MNFKPMKNGAMAIAVAVAAVTVTVHGADAAKNMSHVHIGHVMDGWKGTPGNAGFLPTAIKEAEIANTHAQIALKKSGDLKWLKVHTGHVLNALDPALEAQGPGLGYGVRKAAKGTAKHINLAASSKDASGNVKAHAVHVAMAPANINGWIDQIKELATGIKNASNASEAAPKARKIAEITGWIENGHDANGDGEATWVKGEGGLKQAMKHAGLMKSGEGL